ncbi:MAG: DNA translocase FtsK 4TM domain-containing protein, partial [Bacteroidetes bacterium]|nr:DNA translocase FtsK 4TM domain-containing protein [Bacteroidota bacterium]
ISFRRILFDTSIEVPNWAGRLGATISHQFIKEWFGISSYLILFLLFLYGFKLLFQISLLRLGKTFRISFIALLWLSVTFGFIFFKNTQLSILGGIFGFELTQWLIGLIGKLGLVFLLTFILFSFLVINLNFPFRLRKKKIKETKDTGDARKSNIPKEDKYNTVEFAVTEYNDDTKKENNKTKELIEEQEAGNDQGIELTIEKSISEEKVQSQFANGQSLDTQFDPTLDLPHYQYPTLDLLNDYGDATIVVSQDELEQNKNKIIGTLLNYSIQIDKIKATIGPTVTLYEIIPAPGIRISKIKNLEDDIALSLSALGIRIIAPIPGKGTIGIEVPNQKREIVSIKSVLSSEKFQRSDYELPFVLGKTISNESYIADLTKMPHILMAGATGQGKSVGLNAIIMSLLYKKHPAQLKFVFIDPKKVELTLLSKIERHFLAKLPDSEQAIITDTREVIRTLNSLSIEMDNRYELLKDAQVRNIKEYNNKYINRKLNPNEGHRYIPYIVLVVDEFADLIMSAGKDIENPLTRLAQLARAVGIHLVIATQRPSVNIITGTIKANFPARIAYRVISKVDSRTILDTGGADQLVGRGDMLLSTGSDLIRLQCAYVDTSEIDRITDFIGSQRAYPDAYELPEYSFEEPNGLPEYDPLERDELFEEAARIIVQNQQGSTSLLQRRLKLGYNRAGRIIDQLEAVGIVGHFEGSKAREVKIPDEYTLEQFLRELK